MDITRRNFVKVSSLASIWTILPFAPHGQTPAKVFAGANEKTPSRSEYSSWLNNTNEGPTEKQTLINLDFFKWLHHEYGFLLGIYVVSAGTIDKAGYYGSMNSPVFKHQFPRGFGPIAGYAAEMGTRLGTWLGPDGFGNTPQEESDRRNMIVSLCRNYNFMLLKFDAVVGELRPDKQNAFIEMMVQCRKYCPELIVLNHRLNLGTQGEKYATTQLMDGNETYIDVHMANDQTATHHRAGALSRMLPPNLTRLTEDHGVCLSSCLNYWEDDLILQVFNRNLILAPEIYGNPWLLRDEEYPRLARIVNLARQYKSLLVNGMVLPEKDYGDMAVSRGDDLTRLISLRNISWEPVVRNIKLDDETGLTKGSLIELRQLFPSERVIGQFKRGQSIPVEVLPFRACLLMATSVEQPGLSVQGCDYEIVGDMPGKPAKIRLLAFGGEQKKITLRVGGSLYGQAVLDGRPVNDLLKGKSIGITFAGTPFKEKYHRQLGVMDPVLVPADAESLYEATCFAADNNALEVRSLVRSGPTKIPQVQKARDAFFNQPLFVERGIWDHYMFNGNKNTCFYVDRRHGDPRINGGSLRLDMGKETFLDSLIIKVKDEESLQPFKSGEGLRVEVSANLKTWTCVTILAGKEMSIPLDPARPVRYLRLPATAQSVSEIEGYYHGRPVDRIGWRASNLFSPYRYMRAKAAFEKRFVLEEIPKGSYLAIALNGRHGYEGAYGALRVNGEPVGAPDRSPSYPCNAWEYPVVRTDSNYTYYIPLTEDMKGAGLDAVVLLMDGGVWECNPVVWITAYPTPYVVRELDLIGNQ